MQDKTENKTLNDISLIAMSDVDIHKYLPNIRIVKYSDLVDYNSISDLLPKQRDAVILLTEQVEGYGHWTAIIRYKNKIIYYDSIGFRVDKATSWCKTKQLRKELGEDVPHLSLLLNKALDEGFKVVFNEFEFQNKKANLSTCGRWCCAVISYFMQSKTPSLKGFYNVIMNLSKQWELDKELVVCKIFP